MPEKEKGTRNITVGRDYYEQVEGDVTTGSTHIEQPAPQQSPEPAEELKKVAKEGLQEQYTLLSERLNTLRKAYIIETDETVRFKLKKQIEADEADLEELEKRLGGT